MSSDVPCQVSAEELAHDLASEQLPFWTCKGCQAELGVPFAAAENWMVCKVCGEALCEECITDMLHAGVVSFTDGAQQALGFEPLQNLGFCSTGCIAKAYERDAWAYRRGRLLQHCLHSKDFGTLRDRVRAVCLLDKDQQ